MSVPQFPVLPGLAWPLERDEIWSTTVETSVSGKKTGYGYWVYPQRKYTVSFDVLRLGGAYQEYEQLRTFFNELGGRKSIFTFQDTIDHTATGQNFGTGDGATTKFQLVRSFGGYVEPVFAISGTPVVTVDGTPTAAFTIDDYGMLTFSSAPAASAALQWTGEFLWYCRWDNDVMKFSQMFPTLFSTDKLTFTTEKF